MAATHAKDRQESITDRSRFSDSDTPRSDELKENLAGVGSSLREAAGNALPAAQEQFDRVSERVADKAESLEEALIERIREKPITSILIAGAVGVFAGLFFLRR